MTRAKEMRDLPLAIDATASGNVGIGGTANEYSNYTTLTINHDTSGGILDIERNGNLVGELYTLSATDFGIQTGQATGAMRFRTNAGEVLTLLHTGNVGIGSNNPGADLDIHNSNGATLFMDDTNGRSLNFRTANNSTQNSNISSYAGLYLGGSDNANHVVIESGGDVGIGTNNPFYRLQIDQGTTAQYVTSFRNTADNLQLVVGTTTGGLINIQGKTINNGTAYKIALQSEGGNVGIGTANPLAQLEIDPSAVDTPIFAIRRQDSTSIPLFKFFQDSSVAQGTGHAHINTHNRDLSITADASSTKTLGIYLKTTGQVGIGTDSPSAKLNVSDTTAGAYVRIDGASSGDIGSGVQIYKGSTVAASLYANPTHDSVLQSDNGLTFRAGGTNVIRISSTGEIGIGDNLTGTADLHVEKGTNNNTGHFKMGHTGQRRGYVGISSSQTRWYKIMNYASGEIFTGVAQLFHNRGGGFNQTGAYRTYNVSVAGYNNGIYGPMTATGDSGESGSGVLEFGSDEAMYLKVNSSIYAGTIYFTFTGTGNGVGGGWQFNVNNYSTSLP